MTFLLVFAFGLICLHLFYGAIGMVEINDGWFPFYTFVVIFGFGVYFNQ